MAGQYWTRRRGWGVGITMAVIGLLLLGPRLWTTRALTPTFASKVDQVQPWLAWWRTVLFLLLIGGWPGWVNRLARYQHWSIADRAFVLAQRWRVAAWLIVIELVLVQRMPWRFVEAVAG